MTYLLLATNLVTLGLLAWAMWWGRNAHRVALAWMTERFDQLMMQAGQGLSLARQAQEEREHERAVSNSLEIGSFVPSDEDAARLERAHRVNEGRFLSARGPRA